MEEVTKQVVTSLISALVSAVVGHWGLAKTSEEGKPSSRQLAFVRFGSLLVGLAVFVSFYRLNHKDPPGPALQSIEAKPPFVQVGSSVTVTFRLSRPAPDDITIGLSSSDPGLLTVNPTAIVHQGDDQGTTYAQARAVPTYQPPIEIRANYAGVTKRTEVTVGLGTTPAVSAISNAPPKVTVVKRETNPLEVKPLAPAMHVELPPPTKPAALDPELLGRLEEAQGGLAAEKAYWENVKTHMYPGSSLRPEITSQIYAAESASQRCNRDRLALDAGGLSSCINSINDHLNQLRIQH